MRHLQVSPHFPDPAIRNRRMAESTDRPFPDSSHPQNHMPAESVNPRRSRILALDSKQQERERVVHPNPEGQVRSPPTPLTLSILKMDILSTRVPKSKGTYPWLPQTREINTEKQVLVWEPDPLRSPDGSTRD